MNRQSATREIKSRLSIIEVVKRYVELRRAGNRWVAPCPFHQETKPSFSVNEEEGFFYCFGCQASGDLFDFYSRINGIEFKEALEQLAEEAGVPLGDFRPSAGDNAARDMRKLALRMYDAANRYFRRNLGQKAGEACREYLARRKISPEIIESFELGWSLPEWSGLADHLRRGGFTIRQGVDAGLLAANERGSGYDRFRGRLIFPIKNLSGQVIAFGGRIIGDEDAAKYINSTDSPIYKKGDNLYGLFQARRAISVKKSVILTEGYMDVLSLHQFGCANACGVLGTALTPEQVRRLAGFCSQMELLFDGDAPGRSAAMKACGMILSKGLSCKVVMLPDGEDIDSLLQEKGLESFEALRRYAPDGLDFCIRTLASWPPREALDWVKDFLAAVEQPELLSRFVTRFAQTLDLDEAELRRGLRLPAGHKTGGGAREGREESAPAVEQDVLDRRIMQFVVRCPHHLPELRDAGARLLLTRDWALSLWEKVALAAPDYDPDSIARQLNDAERDFWWRNRVLEVPPAEHQAQELEDIRAVAARRCEEKQADACLQAMRQDADKSDFDMDLLKAFNETLIRQRTLGSSDG
jgi:DNA primase